MSERAIVSIFADGQSECLTAKQARTLVALGLCIPHPGVGSLGIEVGDLRLADGARWPDVRGAVEAMRDEPAEAWSAASHGDASSTAISGGAREDFAKRAAGAIVARINRRLHGNERERVELDESPRVTFLDEPGTGVEGWAYVQAWILVPREAIEAEARR